MPKQQTASGGLRIFSVIWFGQLISTLGSGLTGFALGVWIYEETGSTTLFALNILAYTLPSLLMSPIAGALPPITIDPQPEWSQSTIAASRRMVAGPQSFPRTRRRLNRSTV